MSERPSLNPGAVRLWWAHRRAQGDRSLDVVDGLVREGQTVVDIGADWGLFTCRFAQLVGPAGHVHAFEPNPGRRAMLEDFARAQQNVSFHPVALSDREGPAILHAPLHDGRPVWALGSLAPQARGVSFQSVEVQTTALDRVLTGPVDFVKCDVEGHEGQVLRGAAGLLSRSLPTLLVEIEQRHREEPIDATFEQLLGLGYTGWSVTPAGLKPLAEFDLERDQLRHLEGFQAFEMPADYVHDFLFAPSSRSPSLTRWLAASQE